MKGITNVKIIATIIVAILAGLLYVTFYSVPGIEVSCQKKEIVGFGKIPPPLLQIYQTDMCNVDINVNVGEEKICSGKLYVREVNWGVFPCKELKNQMNKIITIQAIFYDNDNQIIGNDLKEIEYNGI